MLVFIQLIVGLGIGMFATASAMAETASAPKEDCVPQAEAKPTEP